MGGEGQGGGEGAAVEVRVQVVGIATIPSVAGLSMGPLRVPVGLAHWRRRETGGPLASLACSVDRGRHLPYAGCVS